ncbi:MAG: hypothetical protein EXS32_03840 [Opitutus sp.]|nr:hypothetical protein [Opitutus sp.]
MKLPQLSFVFGCGLLVAVAGCTFPSSRRMVPAAQANVMQNAELGTVTAVREVNIEGQKSHLGLLGGGAVGAAATKPGARNSNVGSALGQAAGAVVGAVAGQAVEEVTTRANGQEVTIRLDDGRIVVVAQDVAGGFFRDGDRVRVLHGGGGARVSMATN